MLNLPDRPSQSFIPRNLIPKIEELLSEEPVILVRGARTSGKSTALREVVARRGGTVLDLDRLDLLEAARDDPDGFVRGHREPVLIDEYQRVPELLRSLKLETDRWREAGRFVVTGSVGQGALPVGTETLTGRVHVQTLWPFSQGELRGKHERFVDVVFGEPESLTNGGLGETDRTGYLALASAGGFPLALARTGRSRTRWFRDYASRVAERDLAELVSIRNPAALPRLLRLAAARTAQLLNVADIQRSADLKYEAAAGYLGLLEQVFVLHRLPPWFANLTSKQSKHPKLYLTDTGLAAHLLGLDDTGARLSPAAGQLLETFVVNEVLKQLGWSSVDATAYHFRDRDGAEVDLVLETYDQRVVAIEVKSGTRVQSSDLRGLRLLRDRLGDRFVHGVVLYTGAPARQAERGISILPISTLWDTT